MDIAYCRIFPEIARLRVSAFDRAGQVVAWSPPIEGGFPGGGACP